jgi:DNA-binding LytR/AlgR family response regulator
MSLILDCWIVDDEPLALGLLESYVENTPFLKLTGRFSSAKAALQEMMERQPDLIFLDIQMPHVNGMEFARVIGDHTKIIFTTAFKEYALEGYRVNALDYLMKPVSYVNFLTAAKKVLAWFEAVKAKESMPQQQENREGIFVKSDYKTVRVLFDDILYVEGLKNYVKIYTIKQSASIITLMSMKELEDALPKNRFIRVHRSFIVAKYKIESINKNRLTVAGREIPIGITYKDDFLREVNL